MLCNLKQVMELVQAQNWGLPAFNVFGYEDAKAVICAAEAKKTPVVLMANKVAVNHMGIRILAQILLELGKEASIPVCVHLDHATEIEKIREAIDCGYTSVMFDGSQLPYEENVRITKMTVEAARKGNVSVEAEIGSVGYSDGTPSKSRFTNPEEAARFVADTDVDALAVAIGTVHRMEQQGAQLQFELLKEIHRKVSVPLVIHGSTGVDDSDLTRLIQCGACKINMGTVLRIAFGNTLRSQFEENPKVFDRISLFVKCMERVQQKAEDKIDCLQKTELTKT